MQELTVRPKIVDLGVGAIGRNRLLAGLPPADFALLAPHLAETTLERGTVLTEPGQPIRRVIFLHGGLVSLLGVLPEGDAVDTATIGREGALGLSAGLGSQLAVSRAVVQLPGAAVQISPLRLAEAAAQSKAVRDMIVRYCDALLAQIQQSVVCNTVHHVQERLCRWLLQAHDRIDGDTIPLTQEFVSGLLGVQRTTVTAICRVLQADGIIDVRRGRILIRNAGALTRKSCACYGVVRRLNDQACRGFVGAPNP
ncbi:MAG: Crp/Fnr family transcriptional regulator [Xanthobacteraceae bacterium]